VGPAIALLKAGVVYRRENNLENIKVTDVLAVRTPLSPLSPPKQFPSNANWWMTFAGAEGWDVAIGARCT